MNLPEVEQVVNVVRIVVAAGLLGLVMPVLVSVLVQTSWSRPAKELTVIVSCLVVAMMGMVATGTDLGNIVIAAPVMIALTRKTYLDYWKETGIAAWIEKITDVKQPLNV